LKNLEGVYKSVSVRQDSGPRDQSSRSITGKEII
jgi:hypothetical protein